LFRSWTVSVESIAADAGMRTVRRPNVIKPSTRRDERAERELVRDDVAVVARPDLELFIRGLVDLGRLIPSVVAG